MLDDVKDVLANSLPDACWRMPLVWSTLFALLVAGLNVAFLA